VEPTLANVVGWKLLVSGATSGTCFVSQWKNFPDGSGTFRSPVFSLLGAKVPTGNIRSTEWYIGERTVRV